SAPLTRSFVSAPAPSGAQPHSSLLALPMPEISAPPPVFGRRESRAFEDPRTSRLVSLLALAGVCAACIMLWVGAQRSAPSGTRVESPAAAAAAAWANDTPGAPPAE